MKRLAACLLFFFSLAVFADVSMQIEEHQVQLGQSFSMTISLDGDDVDAVPDLSVLEKDFTIAGSEHNIRYEVINGKARSAGEWTVLLIAKRNGNLTIPAIPIGQKTTAPTTIEVAPTRGTTTQTGNQDDSGTVDPIMLKTEVSEKNPYINQQVILTVKLYNSRRLMDANYEPPRVTDALMVALGQEKRYQTMINGRNFVIEEQQFALFPQKSGELKIQPPKFTALVYDLQPSRVHIQAKPITLKVKPVPNNYQSKNWLPAKQVTLTDTFDQNTSALPEGTTLVRTINLEAVGLPAELLPELDFGKPDTYKVYPEKPQGTNQSKQGDLVGSTQVKVAYFLNQSGLITIPAVKLPWFNVTTGTIAVAELPGFVINVEPTNKNQTSLPSIPVHPDASSPVLDTESKNSDLVQGSGTWLWWLCGGFAILWLFTLFAWYYQRRGLSAVFERKENHYKALRTACATNNAENASIHLLAWAAERWPANKPKNIGDLAERVSDKNFKKQSGLLSEYLYNKSNRQKGWQGAALWTAFVAFAKTKEEASDRGDSLPPLNP